MDFFKRLSSNLRKKRLDEWNRIENECIENKVFTMMRRKSPPSENMLYSIENHCQTNISKGSLGKALILFHKLDKIVLCIHVTIT